MYQVLDKSLPHWRIRNIALFYVLSAIYNVWFVSGVWVFIWGRFMTNTQIGISDLITFTFGFFIELPSGVMADVIGRKKAILAGNILMTLGNFSLALSSSFIGITGWYLVWTAGYAFQSGATEALAYDSLRRENLVKDWEKVIATASVISKTATLSAAAIGGYLFTIWFRLPYLTLAGFGILGIIAASLLFEIRTKKIDNSGISPYLNQIKEGVQTLGKRAVLPIAVLCLGVAGISYMYSWGLLRPLTGERFGYTPETYAYLMSITSLSGIVALSVFPKIRARWSLNKLLFLFSGMHAVVFFWMGFSHFWLIGGILIILQAILSTYVEILFSKFINSHTREEHRATTLSTVSLFVRLPYVLLTVLIGKLADAHLLAEYTLVVGIVALGMWGVSLILFQRSKTGQAIPRTL